MPANDDVLARLTPRERRALVALLEQPTIGDAVAASGLNESTLRRMRQRPHFRDAYAELSRRYLQDSVGKLRAGSARALNVLREAFDEPAAAVRVRAAVAWLTLASQVEVDELVRRVEALEVRAQDDQR